MAPKHPQKRCGRIGQLGPKNLDFPGRVKKGPKKGQKSPIFGPISKVAKNAKSA
jgi:hypothetical protein